MKLKIEQRTRIVIDIFTNLKQFKGPSGSIVDLYSMCNFVNEFKKISNEYIKTGKQVKGVLYFEEIDKYIHYLLPEYENTEPLFVIKINGK